MCYEKLKVYYLFSFGENLPFMMNVDPEIKDAIRRVRMIAILFEFCCPEKKIVHKNKKILVTNFYFY